MLEEYLVASKAITHGGGALKMLEEVTLDFKEKTLEKTRLSVFILK